MNKVAIARYFFVTLFLLVPALLKAQHTFRTTSSGTIIGYMEYLPPDYHNNSDKYPVLIFLHGVDERGVNSTDPTVLKTTINLATKLGPPQHVTAGATMPFILITPQLKKSYSSWPSSYVKEVIDHCKTYLRIDERRIHITGLSMGGHGAWTCIQEMPTLYASGVPVCGAHNTPSQAPGIAKENVAVWAFHGDKDPVVSYTKTVNMVNAINASSPAPSPLAKATIYAGVQHNAWYRAYFLDNNYHTPNFYQWVMQQSKSKRGGNNIPVANAGGDKSVVLPANSVSLAGSGTDNGGSISSYRWTQLQGPSNATLTNATSATATASNLVNGTYVFKLTVTDNGGLIDSDFVKVTVSGTGANVPPAVNAGVDKTIHLPANSTTIAGSATDSDGIKSYSWTKVSGGAATLSGNTTNTLTVSGLVAGTYVFRLTAVDNKSASGSDDVTLIVNNPPTVSAGPDLTVKLPTNSVSIQATASDNDGSISTWSWAKLTGPNATLSGNTSSKLTASGLVAGSYTFRLTVTDNRGATKADDVVVTVTGSSNTAPAANAGADKVITLPTNSVSFSGSGTDSDGSIASYSWAKISGGTATLSNSNTQNLSVSNLAGGSYIFRLTVTDNSGATGIDDVSLFVNNTPVVNAGADIYLNLPTNSVTIQATASDNDGTISTYSWAKPTGGAATMSGTNTSKLTLSGLVVGSYVFRLTVTDNHGASKFDDVMVIVRDPGLGSTIPNKPPVADAGADQLISLPSNSVSLAGNGTDSDGSIVSYNWQKIQGPAATITNSGSRNATASGLVAGIYHFRLTVTDNAGATGMDDVVITVNAPPTVSVGEDFNITLPANSTSIQAVVSDDGTIANYEWMMTTGTVGTLTNANTSRVTVSGLAEGRYVFRLWVTDNHGAKSFDDVLVFVVRGTGGNPPPTVDAGEDQLIHLPANSVTIPTTGTGSITKYTWTKISGPQATLINSLTRTLIVNDMVSGNYVFRVTVVDNAGLSSYDDVAVTVNAPPTVSVGEDFNITLPTNSLTIQGVASDDGSIAKYEWLMTTGTAGTLTNTNTSRLTATGLVEGKYVFRLWVTDNHGLRSFDDVLIFVNRGAGNSPTVDAGPDQLIHLPENSITLPTTGTGSIVKYTWTKVSGPQATLVNSLTKTLIVNNMVSGKYVFRVTVVDNAGLSSYDDVAVTVNAPPTVSVGEDFNIVLPTNSLTIQAVVSDDETITSYQWMMTTGTAGTLNNANTSKLTATGLVEGKYVFRLWVTDNHGLKSFDDVLIFVKAQGTSGAAYALSAPEVIEEVAHEDKDLTYGDAEFWKDKQVVIYDATGKETFSGRWVAERYNEVVEPGKLYIYNILSSGRHLKQGKIFITR